MTSHNDEQRDRQEYLENEKRLKREREASTYLAHTHLDDQGGRFGAINSATIVGQDPFPKYPELPSTSPFHHDPVPDEPPLGFSVNEMQPEPSTVGSAVGTGPTSEADAPSTVLPFSDEQCADDVGPSSSTHTGCNDKAE
jgi:hypothetical protein